MSVDEWDGVRDIGSVAAEGHCQEGRYVGEAAHFLGIVGRGSGKSVEPGASGNICVTVLFKDTVYPIIRFDTQDVSSLLPPDPTSGINFQRITGFSGRSDNMVKLRGVNVYPTAIGRLLHEFEGTTGEYICRLHTSNDHDVLTVIVEYVGCDPVFKEAWSQS